MRANEFTLTTVYHITPRQNIPSITKSGLVPGIGPRSEQYGETTNAIYCFTSKEQVENALMNWLGDEFEEDEELALLAINVTNIPYKITPDAEFECTVKRLIPPDAITVISTEL